MDVNYVMNVLVRPLEIGMRFDWVERSSASVQKRQEFPSGIYNPIFLFKYLSYRRVSSPFFLAQAIINFLRSLTWILAQMSAGSLTTRVIMIGLG